MNKKKIILSIIAIVLFMLVIPQIATAASGYWRWNYVVHTSMQPMTFKEYSKKLDTSRTDNDDYVRGTFYYYHIFKWNNGYYTDTGSDGGIYVSNWVASGNVQPSSKYNSSWRYYYQIMSSKPVYYYKTDSNTGEQKKILDSTTYNKKRYNLDTNNDNHYTTENEVEAFILANANIEPEIDKYGDRNYVKTNALHGYAQQAWFYYNGTKSKSEISDSAESFIKRAYAYSDWVKKIEEKLGKSWRQASDDELRTVLSSILKFDDSESFVSIVNEGNNGDSILISGLKSDSIDDCIHIDTWIPGTDDDPGYWICRFEPIDWVYDIEIDFADENGNVIETVKSTPDNASCNDDGTVTGLFSDPNITLEYQNITRHITKSKDYEQTPGKCNAGNDLRKYNTPYYPFPFGDDVFNIKISADFWRTESHKNIVGISKISIVSDGNTTGLYDIRYDKLKSTNNEIYDANYFTNYSNTDIDDRVFNDAPDKDHRFWCVGSNITDLTTYSSLGMNYDSTNNTLSTNNMLAMSEKTPEEYAQIANAEDSRNIVKEIAANREKQLAAQNVKTASESKLGEGENNNELETSTLECTSDWGGNTGSIDNISSLASNTTASWEGNNLKVVLPSEIQSKYGINNAFECSDSESDYFNVENCEYKWDGVSGGQGKVINKTWYCNTSSASVSGNTIIINNAKERYTTDNTMRCNIFIKTNKTLELDGNPPVVIVIPIKITNKYKNQDNPIGDSTVYELKEYSEIAGYSESDYSNWQTDFQIDDEKSTITCNGIGGNINSDSIQIFSKNENEIKESIKAEWSGNDLKVTLPSNILVSGTSIEGVYESSPAEVKTKSGWTEQKISNQTAYYKTQGTLSGNTITIPGIKSNYTDNISGRNIENRHIGVMLKIKQGSTNYYTIIGFSISNLFKGNNSSYEKDIGIYHVEVQNPIPAIDVSILPEIFFVNTSRISSTNDEGRNTVYDIRFKLDFKGDYQDYTLKFPDDSAYEIRTGPDKQPREGQEGLYSCEYDIFKDEEIPVQYDINQNELASKSLFNDDIEETKEIGYVDDKISNRQRNNMSSRAGVGSTEEAEFDWYNLLAGFMKLFTHFQTKRIVTNLRITNALPEAEYGETSIKHTVVFEDDKGNRYPVFITITKRANKMASNPINLGNNVNNYALTDADIENMKSEDDFDQYLDNTAIDIVNGGADLMKNNDMNKYFSTDPLETYTTQEINQQILSSYADTGMESYSGDIYAIKVHKEGYIRRRDEGGDSKKDQYNINFILQLDDVMSYKIHKDYVKDSFGMSPVLSIVGDNEQTGVVYPSDGKALFRMNRAGFSCIIVTYNDGSIQNILVYAPAMYIGEVINEAGENIISDYDPDTNDRTKDLKIRGAQYYIDLSADDQKELVFYNITDGVELADTLGVPIWNEAHNDYKVDWHDGDYNDFETTKNMWERYKNNTSLLRDMYVTEEGHIELYNIDLEDITGFGHESKITEDGENPITSNYFYNETQGYHELRWSFKATGVTGSSTGYNTTLFTVVFRGKKSPQQLGDESEMVYICYQREFTKQSSGKRTWSTNIDPGTRK